MALFLIAGRGHAQNVESSDSLTRELQEVLVTAKQPATKLVGSTLVSTIPGSNLADLGNALDVLAQLPMIKVEDNTVSVIGKSNIEIYIYGRPMRDGQELQQLLSSNLKKVELLMAPGAAYTSTTGAVLKITTRRNFVQGLSFTDQFQLQRRRKWSVMDYLSLSYRLHISPKVLTDTLKNLESAGVVSRKLYAEIPPKVEYSLTELGKSLMPHIEGLVGWAIENFNTFHCK